MKRSLFVLVAVVGSCVFLTGCRHTQTEMSEIVFERYSQIIVKQSDSASVLSIIRPLDAELLSQSESVVALWGSDEKLSLLWFNAIAFDEEYMTVTRKYCFIGDVTAKGYFVAPAKKLALEFETVLPPDIADEPYANENAKRIAIMEYISTTFNDDMLEVTSDGQTIESAVLMAKQTINTVLHNNLIRSPALAARLSDEAGLTFDHISLGKGRACMTVSGDTANIIIKVGKGWLAKPVE